MRPARIPVAIVHHANQYLITNGYVNRPGIGETIGPTDGSSGLRAILELHSKYDIPFHLHISGTLIETCAWFDPLFLEEISDLWRAGLVELIGSTYAQNIMTLFSQDFNRFQLEEELRLYQAWLGVSTSDVKGFWIPERVWDTERLAETVRNASLCNGGYRYVLADDRLFLQGDERASFDEQRRFDPSLYKPYVVKDTSGLIALPISTEMRLNMPFQSRLNEEKLDQLMNELQQEVDRGEDVIAIYGDDMEKAAGIPPMWDPQSIQHYELFLKWLTNRQDVVSVLLGDWLNKRTDWPSRSVGPGTYMELAGIFGAGEDYSGWAGSSAWAPYQQMIEKAWESVFTFAKGQAAPCLLIDLAIKHLLASAYETGWHDPGVSWEDASPAPWARALASHARAAYVLLKAAEWQQDTDSEGLLKLEVQDIDEDGHEEVILRNQDLAVVISPTYGGRILYAFSFKEQAGRMFIGNPTDDWNLLEELNGFMDTPMNHPGALADYGYEHDVYEIESSTSPEDFQAELVLVNRGVNSPAYGLKKRFLLNKNESRIRIRYEQIPPAILPLSLDIGMSTDYLRLIREGRASLDSYTEGGKRGIRAGNLFAWVYPTTSGVKWHIPRSPVFGHGICIGLTLTHFEGSFDMGVDCGYGS
ncbi:hypothetical protein [Paenibacillus qinlingensis]|uniref:Glycoside hydrolase family 57 N-terminal domain-containing protein n=1 Tax=Paenibacillus qinlingensis TaxID=1837343 RepID=A0ABU1NUD0_9BACL|nr:hypothetical protein [Paenibacillus qinlingensis]MDR6550686.1 hypothetical protein [Paenibacillus qinlingensis]